MIIKDFANEKVKRINTELFRVVYISITFNISCISEMIIFFFKLTKLVFFLVVCLHMFRFSSLLLHSSINQSNIQSFIYMFIAAEGVLHLRARKVNLGTTQSAQKQAIKRYSMLARAPELKLCHLMQFSIITRTPLGEGGVLTLHGGGKRKLLQQICKLPILNSH